jgi:hypothetical protein
MEGMIIRVDGTTEIVTFTKEASYEAIKSAVGGWIECVSLRDDLDMYVNEEGKLLGLPVNATATSIWEAHYGPTDIIVGDVILTGGADDEGDTLGLNAEQLSVLHNEAGYGFLSMQRSAEASAA